MKARVCKRCKGLVFDGEDCGCKPRRSDEGAATSHERGYTRRWRKFRKRLWEKWVREGRKLVCADCGKPFTRMPHFDHITPVQSADDPLFYDENNIQPLHPGCHGRKTREDMREGRTRPS